MQRKTDQIPLGSNESLSLYASSSKTAILKFQKTGSDCYFLIYSSSLSLLYPSKLIAFQHLCSCAHKVNFIILTWTFKSTCEFQAGSYRLLLYFPLTFQLTLVGQCVELMMHKHTVHMYMAHAQTCSRCHTHRNTRWRWSGAACRLPGALSKSSPQGKRRDFRCLQWELWVWTHTRTHKQIELFKYTLL